MNINEAQELLAKANDTPVQKKMTPAQRIKKVLDNASMKELLETSLKDGAGAFATSIIEAYSADKTLQACDPSVVARECLKAASLKLPINKSLGFAYVIPYNNVPQFQIGYKGLLQLCLRSGQYKAINSGIVYEGELKSIDKLTGEIDISGEATSDKVIGYFAYMETVNGFRRTEYWTRDKVVKHAEKFSKSYRYSSSVWSTNFDSMAMKTVLKHMISLYGCMSVDLQDAIIKDRDDSPADINPETGEVVEVTDFEVSDGIDQPSEG